METSLPWPELACLPYWFEIVAFFLLSVADCSSITLLMYQIFCISLGFSFSKNHKIYTRIYVSDVDDTALHLLTDELTWSDWLTREGNNWMSNELWMTLRAVLLRTMRFLKGCPSSNDFELPPTAKMRFTNDRYEQLNDTSLPDSWGLRTNSRIRTLIRNVKFAQDWKLIVSSD